MGAGEGEREGAGAWERRARVQEGATQAGGRAGKVPKYLHNGLIIITIKGIMVYKFLPLLLIYF